ncbi:LysR substrate-binding domain-containing protein [Candidatus Spongiihabitans sp.]|uniref:LysR substrate-binding domain-containing protein n=1 Tax=Candidatus Spongiihabitans sp. TaxID=3101308 RepID=UPI003C6F58FA
MTEIISFSLSGIRAFECSARCQSFTKASKKLCLTQGAVSKQIRSLEERLGFTLFHRLPRKLVLTEEGRVLFDTVHPALLAIEKTISEIKSTVTNKTVVLSAPESLSMKWLIPRVGRLLSDHPDIELLIEAENRYVDLADKQADILIRYGDGNYPGHHVQYMMDEYLVPVCSPALSNKTIDHVNALRDYKLLDDKNQSKWTQWFKANKLKHLDKKGRLRFSRDDLMVEAAISGQGIAMSLWRFVEDDIAKNRLVPLFNYNVVAVQL